MDDFYFILLPYWNQNLQHNVESGEKGHSNLVPNLKGKQRCPLSGFKLLPSNPNFLKLFFRNGCWIFVKCFIVSIKIKLYWLIFQMLNQTLILRINSIYLFSLYTVRFDLLKICLWFLHLYSWGILGFVL